jgi:hypothetical protein
MHCPEALGSLPKPEGRPDNNWATLLLPLTRPVSALPVPEILVMALNRIRGTPEGRDIPGGPQLTQPVGDVEIVLRSIGIRESLESCQSAGEIFCFALYG